MPKNKNDIWWGYLSQAPLTWLVLKYAKLIELAVFTSPQFQVNASRLEAQAELGPVYIESDHIGEGPQFILIFFFPNILSVCFGMDCYVLEANWTMLDLTVRGSVQVIGKGRIFKYIKMSLYEDFGFESTYKRTDIKAVF